MPSSDINHLGVQSSSVNSQRISLKRNEFTPTTAGSGSNRDNIFSASTGCDLIDPVSGKPIQQRKKTELNIEKELESQGSIITGRNELRIL